MCSENAVGHRSCSAGKGHEQQGEADDWQGRGHEETAAPSALVIRRNQALRGAFTVNREIAHRGGRCFQPNDSRLDNQFPLHGSMTPSAVHTATKWIAPRGLGHKFDDLCMAFLDLHATRRRGKNEALSPFRIDPAWEWCDPETMRMIGCGDFQLDPCSLFNANR